MNLLRNINDFVDDEDIIIEGYLHQAFLLDENGNMISESLESFLKVAYTLINDESDDVENKEQAEDNLAKIIVGLLQWKSAGVRGKDPVLYRDIQKKLSSTYIDDTIKLGTAEKNKKLLDKIRQNIKDDKETIVRILDDLKSYFSKNGILKKSNVTLDISDH